MKEEARGIFSARMSFLGHMQQGGVTTPFDRNLGIKFGARSLKYMADILDSSSKCEFSDVNTAVVISLVKNKLEFTSVSYLKEFGTDFPHRIPIQQWWMKLRPLARILGKHEAVYSIESSDEHLPCEERGENTPF